MYLKVHVMHGFEKRHLFKDQNIYVRPVLSVTQWPVHYRKVNYSIRIRLVVPNPGFLIWTHYVCLSPSELSNPATPY